MALCSPEGVDIWKAIGHIKDVNYSHEVARVEPCDNDSESQSNGKSFLEHLYYLFWHANRLGDIIAVPPPLPEPPDIF